jgi:hypothetical protein
MALALRDLPSQSRVPIPGPELAHRAYHNQFCIDKTLLQTEIYHYPYRSQDGHIYSLLPQRDSKAAFCLTEFTLR